MADKKTRIYSREDACEGEGSKACRDAMHLAVLVNCGAAMRLLEGSVLKALNSVVVEHGDVNEDVRVTVVLAGERIEVAAHRVLACEFAPFERGAFRMHGCCMLMDALYETVLYMEDVVFAFEGCVKIVIITNDAEATSCAYPYADVLALVEEKRAAGWEFKLLSIC